MTESTEKTYKYLEDFHERDVYHVFVVDRIERSLCNFVALSTHQVKKLLDQPPKLRNKMCEDCKIVKEMVDNE